MNDRNSASTDAQDDHGLTAREWEIVRLAAEGFSEADMAERLCISKATAHNHLMHAYEKVGVSRRVDLVLWYLRVESGKLESEK